MRKTKRKKTEAELLAERRALCASMCERLSFFGLKVVPNDACTVWTFFFGDAIVGSYVPQSRQLVIGDAAARYCNSGDAAAAEILRAADTGQLFLPTVMALKNTSYVTEMCGILCYYHAAGYWLFYADGQALCKYDPIRGVVRVVKQDAMFEEPLNMPLRCATHAAAWTMARRIKESKLCH